MERIFANELNIPFGNIWKFWQILVTLVATMSTF